MKKLILLLTLGSCVNYSKNEFKVERVISVNDSILCDYQLRYYDGKIGKIIVIRDTCGKFLINQTYKLK